MKLQSLSCGAVIFGLIASVVDAKAKFYDTVHATRKVVPGAYIVEFDESVDNRPSFLAHFNRKSFPSITVRHDFQSEFMNGMSFSVDGNHSVNSILEAPGIKNVWPVTLIPSPNYSRRASGEKGLNKRVNKEGLGGDIDSKFDTMHNLTGVTEVHELLKIFGKSVKVGIIDIGVYYKHPAFGINGKPGCYKKPGCRFQYGYDFVGDNYSEATLVAKPDDDPFENCSKSSHGTHVAGIVGANASSIQGEFKPAFPFYGVAPQVTFGAYRVFGCSADYTTNEIVGKAIERAASDGMDIINLSLGGGPAWHEEFPDNIVNRASAKGHIIVSSIGNFGGSGLWVGSNPGVSEGGFGVGSVDSQRFLMNTIKDDSGKAYSYSLAVLNPKVFSGIKAKIIVNNPNANSTNGTLDGCKPLTYKAKGAVVLFQASSCPFNTTCDNARDAGAAGCLIYSTNPGDNFFIYFKEEIKIPCGSLTASMGQAIIALVKAKPDTIFDFTGKEQLFDAGTPGAPSIFTSWAMDPDLLIKPNIAAIGGNVYSTMSPTASAGVGYGTLSGTSMAAPYLAGSLALYISSKGKSDFGLLKARFQNAAHPTYSLGKQGYASVAQQGAGIVNVLDAIRSTTIVTPSELALNDTVNMKKSYKILIKNEHSTAIDYVFEHEPALTVYSKDNTSDSLLDQPIEITEYASVSFSEDTVRIAAGKAREITVQFKAPKASDPDRIPVFSGYIAVHAKLLDAPSSRVTYAGLKGSWQDAPIFSMVGPPGGIVTGVYDTIDTPIKAGTVLNATKSIHVNVVLSTPTRLYYVQVLVASSTKQAKSEFLGYVVSPTLTDSLTEIGPVYVEYAGRNILPRNAFNTYQWNGLISNSSTGETNSSLPIGDYKLRFYGLTHFGNPKDPSDFEVIESHVFKLVY